MAFGCCGREGAEIGVAFFFLSVRPSVLYIQLQNTKPHLSKKKKKKKKKKKTPKKNPRLSLSLSLARSSGTHLSIFCNRFVCPPPHAIYIYIYISLHNPNNNQSWSRKKKKKKKPWVWGGGGGGGYLKVDGPQS